MKKYDLKCYKKAMDVGKGVAVINWAIEGAPSGNGSWSSYYPWDGSGDFDF